MPTTLSVDSFAELVQRSRLLTADQVQKVLQELVAEGRQVDTPEALADALVRRELLTSWQVGFLLKGKHSGFFLGSYRFLKMLGKGGMGAVYLAEHQMMRRRCAIKVLPSKLISDSSSVLDRFYLEAQAVAALDDPNIVRAYDVNKEMQGKREIHYLVMEYVDGCDLQVLVQRKGPLDYVQVADFSRQAASGLAHAHESGLIHRDIKPANLLIDERGTVKILDLGLARFFDDRLDASLTTTHNESILGTADYLSPEQALDSHNVDTRTDIYSLGCTCYYMLTGHPPFPEGSVAQRLMSHQAKSPKAIEKIRPDAPTDLVTIVEKMLAKSADNRYQTAREVADAFTEWLAKHGGEDWKTTHREIVEGSVSQIRREPTRARSAATEETDLELGLAPSEELGLAPMEESEQLPSQVRHASNETKQCDATSETKLDSDLRLDQLEELAPLTDGFDTGSPSGGLDNLLNEALDNYPALDSNLSLGGSPVNPGMSSGVHLAARPAPADAAERKQLLKLILIGFAVSVPLSVVILIVSSRFSETAQTVSVDSYEEPTEDVAPPDTEPVSEPTRSTGSATPVTDDGKSNPTEDSQTLAANNVVDTPTPPTDKQSPTPSQAQPEKPSATTLTTPPPAMTTLTPTTEASPNSAATVTPDTSTVRPEPPQASAAPTAEPAPKSNKQPDAKKPELEPTSPERIKELFAGLSEVTIQLDRKPKNSYDLMVLKTAEEALQRVGLKVTPESQEASAAILTLSFEAEKAESSFIFKMAAELKCRDGESQEVSVWKHQEEVAQLRASALGNTPPSVLRNKVSGFYMAFVREYRRAVTGSE
jgi:serine/threonine-protein kinase